MTVGDTSFDMQVAANAGTDGVGVDWGYHQTHELSAAGALSVIDPISRLPETLSILKGFRRPRSSDI